MNLIRSVCGLLSFLMLMHCTVNRQSTENIGLSYGDYVQDMQRKARMATAKKYIYSDLLKNHDILPTASAIELIYLLNPQLAQMPTIPENYKLILPQRPSVTDSLKNSMLRAFEYDSEYDPERQRALDSSGRSCIILFSGLHHISNWAPGDTLALAMNQLYAALRELDLTGINRVQCTQLINLLSGCSNIMSRSINNARLTDADRFGLMDICYDLSFLLPSNALRDFFRKFKYPGRQYTLSNEVVIVPQDAGNLEHYALRGPMVNNFDAIPFHHPVFSNGNKLRSFRVSVQLRKGNKIISDGPEVTGRYKVSFFAPALEAYTASHLQCDALATYSSINLSAVTYGTKVLDVRTNKECIIIGSVFVDASVIVHKPGTAIYEIQIFVNE
ncbi:hypothetical protein GFS24_15985 [Chitinophaga sp. SYP-B3965]|uniref:hypothetical protein n=1 Tax=Chitinophaga sp. SYP-B3965 TaxID=2663120 RepID=UPI00129A041F|nr:hypothetical protein [Chitinophaga sp. SYP-B3965]MRG46624.1 hypothetical protein [Chitinophaga sp. SYP-B3965]